MAVAEVNNAKSIGASGDGVEVKTLLDQQLGFGQGRTGGGELPVGEPSPVGGQEHQQGEEGYPVCGLAVQGGHEALPVVHHGRLDASRVASSSNTGSSRV